MGERVMPGRRAGVAAKRRRVAGAVVGVTLLLGALGALSYSPLFGADEVRIEGIHALSTEAVTDLAGVAEGTNVLHLDEGAAELALRADPWIASATVVADLPRTIIVRIEERRPVAIAAGNIVAADAVALPGAVGRGLPVIETVGGSLGPADLEAGATAAGAMTPETRSLVDSILVEPDGDLVLTLSGGVTVFYGRPGQDAAKAEALRALMRWAGEESVEIESFDVSVPTAPTARPVGGAAVVLP